MRLRSDCLPSLLFLLFLFFLSHLQVLSFQDVLNSMIDVLNSMICFNKHYVVKPKQKKYLISQKAGPNIHMDSLQARVNIYVS